jgi:hypothetical protein
MRREADQKLNCTFMHRIRYPASALRSWLSERRSRPITHVLEQVAGTNEGVDPLDRRQ